MTIDEAMGDLSVQLEVKRILGMEREANALRLGLEALKHLKTIRKNKGGGWSHRLPGETGE